LQRLIQLTLKMQCELSLHPFQPQSLTSRLCAQGFRVHHKQIRFQTKEKTNMPGTAIVTGGSGGIGREIAETLGADGFDVIVHFSGTPDKANEAVAEIRQLGGSALAIEADVTDPASVKDLFKKAIAAFGSISVVVHAAGIMPLSPIAKGDVETFDKVIAVNLRGSFLVMSEAANQLMDGGRLITFSSSVIGKSLPSYGPYIASKAGVEGLTKVLANEVGERKICVNAIAPGPVATPLFLKDKSEEMLKGIAKQTPLQRIGEASDIAPVVSFLASAASGWITGQVIRVNGGFV
jgi:3-oxoacyl-[acyl-carrier protein] reductase